MIGYLTQNQNSFKLILNRNKTLSHKFYKIKRKKDDPKSACCKGDNILEIECDCTYGCEYCCFKYKCKICNAKFKWEQGHILKSIHFKPMELIIK